LLLGIAQSALELGDYATARYYLRDLTRHYPENARVQQTQKALTLYSRPQLSIKSSKGRSSTEKGTRGDNDFQLETILRSAPFKDHYSVFLRTFNAEADFDDTVAKRRRLGIGSQYKTPDWQLTLELNQNQNQEQGHDVGVRLGGIRFLNDHWQLETEYESNSDDIPLQAHANAIDAKSLSVGIGFSRNESRKLGMDFSHLWLSDNNRRAIAQLSWFERWVSQSVYKLDTQLTLSGSRNSRRDVDYFNPRHDVSVDFLAINEWTVWRSNQSAQQRFKHRLTLGAGTYQQHRLGYKKTFNARYEQQWNLDSRRSLSYGIEYALHPYEGITDKRTAFFLELDWHF
jgi:hypothetical protein